MIHEVDAALQGLLAEEVLAATGTDVVFEAPTKDWAARRSGPAINVFLYDVREDLTRRQQGLLADQDDDGTVTAVHEPPRWYSLSYLVTAWTKRPQDEHRLLSALLAGLAGAGYLPPDRLTGSLAELGLTVPLSVALPETENRALANIWSALGGELKPSLGLVVTAPLVPRRRPVAPPVSEAMELRVHDRSDAPDAGARNESRRRFRGPSGSGAQGPVRR
jgi:hypothetical protein